MEINNSQTKTNYLYALKLCLQTFEFSEKNSLKREGDKKILDKFCKKILEQIEQLKNYILKKEQVFQSNEHFYQFLKKKWTKFQQKINIKSFQKKEYRKISTTKKLTFDQFIENQKIGFIILFFNYKITKEELNKLIKNFTCPKIINKHKEIEFLIKNIYLDQENYNDTFNKITNYIKQTYISQYILNNGEFFHNNFNFGKVSRSYRVYAEQTKKYLDDLNSQKQNVLERIKKIRENLNQRYQKKDKLNYIYFHYFSPKEKKDIQQRILEAKQQKYWENLLEKHETTQDPYQMGIVF